MSIEDEFPPEEWIDFQQELTALYTRLRSRAAEMEKENRFLEWQLACAQSRWDDARRMEREGALDRQAIGRVMSNQTISANPQPHQNKP